MSCSCRFEVYTSCLFGSCLGCPCSTTATNHTGSPLGAILSVHLHDRRQPSTTNTAMLTRSATVDEGFDLTRLAGRDGFVAGIGCPWLLPWRSGRTRDPSFDGHCRSTSRTPIRRLTRFRQIERFISRSEPIGIIMPHGWRTTGESRLRRLRPKVTCSTHARYLGPRNVGDSPAGVRLVEAGKLVYVPS